MRLILKHLQSKGIGQGKLNNPPITWEESYLRPVRVLTTSELEFDNNFDVFSQLALLTTLYGDSSLHSIRNVQTPLNVIGHDYSYFNNIPIGKLSPEEQKHLSPDGRLRVILLHDWLPNSKNHTLLYPDDPRWNDYFNRIHGELNYRKQTGDIQ